MKVHCELVPSKDCVIPATELETLKEIIWQMGSLPLLAGNKLTIVIDRAEEVPQ